MGSLDRIWPSVPGDLSMDALQDEFQNQFGAKWAEVLDPANASLSYNAANTAYFAVRNVRLVEGLTLDQLLTQYGNGKPPNILVS